MKTTTITKSEAIELLRQNAEVTICMSCRDATLQWYQHYLCWLDDGELVRSHPTQPNSTCTCPADGKYVLLEA